MYVVRLAHPCGTSVVLLLSPDDPEALEPHTYSDIETGENISDCPGCGQALGSPFVAVEVFSAERRPDARKQAASAARRASRERAAYLPFVVGMVLAESRDPEIQKLSTMLSGTDLRTGQ